MPLRGVKGHATTASLNVYSHFNFPSIATNYLTKFDTLYITYLMIATYLPKFA